MTNLAGEIERLISLGERLDISDDELELLFWRFYPRYRFIKTLPLDAALLDIGAGSGGLHLWAGWGSPPRHDLRFYGVDLQRGQWADRYADWQVADLDQGLPEFSTHFDAFLASHLIEHVASPLALIAAMRRQAATGARMYLEWPHPRSAGFPSAAELAKRGFVVQTVNFHDDHTHLRPLERSDVTEALAAEGFRTVEEGEIALGVLAEELMARGRRRDDLTWRQMGLWSRTGWCNYVIAERSDAPAVVRPARSKSPLPAAAPTHAAASPDVAPSPVRPATSVATLRPLRRFLPQPAHAVVSSLASVPARLSTPSTIADGAATEARSTAQPQRPPEGNGEPVGLLPPVPGSYLPEFPDQDRAWRKGRSVYEGYQRGWGLAFGALAEKVEADPDFQDALSLARGRSILDRHRMMNLFLLMKFFVPRLAMLGGPQHVIEFGSYRGGSAFFLARLAQRFCAGMRIFALDTFGGMPQTDHSADLHRAGDFADVEFAEISAARQAAGLHNLELVQGLFSDTLAGVLAGVPRFALVHIDCDIREPVAYAYDETRAYMAPGGYVVFDDSVVASCLGATEVVEQLVIQRDGLLSEQIYPHHVFRAPTRP